MNGWNNFVLISELCEWRLCNWEMFLYKLLASALIVDGWLFGNYLCLLPCDAHGRGAALGAVSYIDVFLTAAGTTACPSGTFSAWAPVFCSYCHFKGFTSQCSGKMGNKKAALWESWLLEVNFWVCFPSKFPLNWGCVQRLLCFMAKILLILPFILSCRFWGILLHSSKGSVHIFTRIGQNKLRKLLYLSMLICIANF